MTGLDAEIAVVGLGALGSSALWRLAVRGRDVIGIEQYRPGHPHGSTHGLTRLFRTLCFEHPGLVPVARRSLGLWRELEEESGNELLRLSGGLMIGARDSRVVAGVLEAARAGAQDVDVLSARRLRGTFPQHGDVRDDDVAVWDPEAGVGRPEAAVVSAVAAARARGARVVEQVGVQAVEPVDDGVRVRTSARDFVVRQAVVTPGPWLSRLVPALPMRPLRTPLTWFSPSGDPAEYELGRFPVFIRQLHDGAALWGHGSTGDHGVKIGPDDDGNYHHVDPDRVDRSIGPGDYALISRLVGRVLPGLDPQPTAAETCMVTRTPDGQFLLGRPHGDRRLVLGAGGSGHAFKHAPALGEAMAQLVCGETLFTDLSFLDPNRFLSAAASSPRASPLTS